MRTSYLVSPYRFYTVSFRKEINPTDTTPLSKVSSDICRSYCLNFVRTCIQQLTVCQLGSNNSPVSFCCRSWWRHQMETFSALQAICAGNSPVTGEFPAQRPVTRSFDVFFDLRPNKRLSKQSGGWWFETASRPFWRHCNGWIESKTHNPLFRIIPWDNETLNLILYAF